MADERLSQERLSRARFIRLGAIAGAGATLAACGGGGEAGGGGNGSGGAANNVEPTDGGVTGGVENAPEATGGGGQSGEAQGGGEAQGEAIASESEVQPGSAVEFTAPDGNPAVLVRLDGGDFAAYSAICTHAQCTVAFQNGSLACPCHGSLFDPANGGAVVQGPAQQPLPEVTVEVRGGEVFTA